MRTRHPRPSGRAGRPRLWLEWHAASGRWLVRIRLRGQRTLLGSFADPVNACVARNTWLAAHEGSLAYAFALRQAAWKRRPHRADCQRADCQRPAAAVAVAVARPTAQLPAPAGPRRSLLEELEKELGH